MNKWLAKTSVQSLPANVAGTLAFLLGFLSIFRVSVIGSLQGNEIALIALIPFCALPMVRSLRSKGVSLLFWLGAAYLLSQITSDIYRNTPAHDFLRGWAKIGITLASLLVFSSVLIGNSTARVAFLVGIYLAPLVSLWTAGVSFTSVYAYKFGVGQLVSVLMFSCVCLVPTFLRKGALLMLFVVGVLAFFEDARSLAGITIIAGLVTVIQERVGGQAVPEQRGTSTSPWKIVGAAIILGLAATAILSLYSLAASTGWLGEASREKYEMQAQSSQSGQFSIFSGRNEILFTGPKIASSPLLGYGSWAKDRNYVYARAAELGLNPEEFVSDAAADEPDLIPTHSHIFGAWIEAGILGALFWSVVFWKTAEVIVYGKNIYGGRIAPLMNFIVVGLLWDILFSPYGGDRRLFDGFILAWIAWSDDRWRESRLGGHYGRDE